MRPPTRTFTCTLTALALFASSASGDPPRPENATGLVKLEAERRNAEGLRRYQQGDYDGARLAFQQAWSVLASVKLLYNLSRAEVKSGHALEALVHLRQILHDPEATSGDREKAQNLMAEANHVTAHIAIEAPAGAELYIDDVEHGAAPAAEPFDVSPGSHKCEARIAGSSRVIDVDATLGEVVTARFAVDAASPPAVSAPIPLPALAPAKQEPAKPPSRVSARSNAHVVVPLAIGGIAVGALVVGGAFGLESKAKENDASSFRASHPEGFCANRLSGPCTQYASILDSQQSATDVERAFLVAGGVLAVGAVVTYLAWPKSQERTTWLVPEIGPRFGAVVLGRNF
jgi:hypothetical protein